MISPVSFYGNDKVSDSLISGIVVTGHRGAGGLAPENTLSAIDSGLSYGVDRIEVDVRQTRDGVIVCMHDDKIDRTTNGKGYVNEYTFKELSSFDAGSWFSADFKNERVPGLEQVLQKTINKAVLLIEIKDGNERYPNIEEKVISIINKYKANSWAIVHSFNDSVLFRMHKLDTEIKLHKLLVADFPFLYLLYDGKLRIIKPENYFFVDEFSVSMPFATKKFIDKVHKLNKKVNVWTVNDKIKINRLINLGVDGIITDYPNYIKKKL